MITKSARVQTTDRNINQLQQNIFQRFDQITINPIINGLIVSQNLNGGTTTQFTVLSANNPTEVSHNLGRRLIGWLIIGNGAQSYVWDSQASNTQANGHSGPDKTLLLNVSADTILTIYAF